MRRRIRRHIRRKAAPKIRRCACAGAREGAKERMAEAGGLMIGGAKDPAEARADARAAQALSAAPVIHRKCAECEADEARRSLATGVAAPGKAAAPAPKAAETAVKALGPGRPLSAPERAFFEPRLGADLTPVRLHEDAAADTAAEAMDAAAFTLGRDIAFARGARSQALLAHELAHAAEEAPVARRTVARASSCRNHPTMPSEAAALDEIARTDARAQEICSQVAAGLRSDADNIGCGGGRAYRAYLRWMGHPRRLRRRTPTYRTRFGGREFPTLYEAVRHELRELAARFDRLGRRLSRGIVYNCAGAGGAGLEHCPDDDCGDDFAITCGTDAQWALCREFWTAYRGLSLGAARDARAGVLIHEAAHVTLDVDDFSPDLPGFDNLRPLTPECLGQLAMQFVEADMFRNDQCAPVPAGSQEILFLTEMECGQQPAQAAAAAPDRERR